MSTYVEPSAVLKTLMRGAAEFRLTGIGVDDLLYQAPSETIRDFRVALAAGLLGEVQSRATFAVDHSTGSPVCTLVREHILGVEIAVDDSAPLEGRVVRREG